MRTKIRIYSRAGVAWRAAAILLSICAYLILSSCHAQKPVQLNEEWMQERQKLHYKNSVLRDTVFVHDSVFVSVKGDTVRIEKWRDKYIEHLRTDTLKILLRDTIYTSRREVVRIEPTLFQKAKIGAFWWLVLVIGVLLVVIFVRK